MGNGDAGIDIWNGEWRGSCERVRSSRGWRGDGEKSSVKSVIAFDSQNSAVCPAISTRTEDNYQAQLMQVRAITPSPRYPRLRNSDVIAIPESTITPCHAFHLSPQSSPQPWHILSPACIHATVPTGHPHPPQKTSIPRGQHASSRLLCAMRHTLSEPNCHPASKYP